MLAASTQGYAQTQPDPHHPAQGAGTTETTPGTEAQEGMSMPAMMKMMAGMMKMMGGGPAGMGGMDISSMGMTERVEGRIAFLRAELQITAAQSKAWDVFAEALRSNAKRLKEANMPMMGDSSPPQLLAQLDSQEQMLGARLEGVRAMKAALAPLYKALSAEQRKTADELLATHMGLMPSGMTQAGTMPAQQNMQ
ncbi:MAG: Spy/CpxP family protein refolding chaperone [Rhizobiales bacterium]|nr:Spy/CpxP family protein refolding chaperone [Hyphomicrobiales bacterium]MBI3672073.1 Spy/CpxP family protein refolding chaperone [Hyphomicrobiales bacterium]